MLKKIYSYLKAFSKLVHFRGTSGPKCNGSHVFLGHVCGCPSPWAPCSKAQLLDTLLSWTLYLCSKS